MKPGSEVQVCTEWLQKWALWSKADVGLGCGSPSLGVEQQQLLLGGCVAAFLFIRAVSGSDGCWLPSLLKLPVSSAERAAGSAPVNAMGYSILKAVVVHCCHRCC